MRLDDFCQLLDKQGDFRYHCIKGAEEIEVTRLVSDSRKAGPGAVFACVKGEHSDGHDFAAQAVAAGASVLLCERELPLNVPQILCHSVRRRMGAVASVLYRYPSESLSMIAITGTNGKTTSAFMTRSILEKSGIKCGMLGTIYYDDGVKCEDAEHTTPEGSDLQQWLASMLKNGCQACVMEASSHAIEQGRLEGVMYDRAGFTNLTRDHLDYHGDMETYFNAKKLLFEKYMKSNWRAAVNIDDEYGRRLVKTIGVRNVISFSTKNVSADFYAVLKSVSMSGMYADFKTPDSKNMFPIYLPILGKYNVMNALLALSLSWSMEVGISCAAVGLEEMRQVPGRLERYMVDGCACVIDFAHTPDALEKVLSALRPLCRGRLSVVFGAGGDRDKTKRPIMGEIATRLADSVIITSDNPRSENPSTILSEIIEGALKHSTTPYKVIEDRREAIYKGLDALVNGDMLLIAGKGPERFQILKDGPHPLLDKDVFYDWCALRGRNPK